MIFGAVFIWSAEARLRFCFSRFLSGHLSCHRRRLKSKNKNPTAALGHPLGHAALQREFLRRVGPAHFERRPTIGKCQEILVGRRGEAPLAPPYRLRSRNKAMALLRGEGGVRAMAL